MDDDAMDDGKQKLIIQQERNFKALYRAMSKIDLDCITEKWEFEEHITILKSKWELIDKTHWELEDELKGSNLIMDYSQKYEALEQKYDNIKRALNSKMWSSVHYQRSAPKIDIPEFSGNYVHWITFKDIFMETIHNNPSISKAQKMQYLKTKLKGEAERLVQHLSISGDNYDSCWEILSHRYDNRRLQFTSFMSTMQNIPAIQHPNANNMKRMHDVITECMNGLGNMGVEVSNWGPMIVYNMSQKLDSITLNEYTKETQNNRELPNLEEFLGFLELKFLAYETAKGCSKETIENKIHRPNNRGWNNNYKPNNFPNKQQDMKKLGYSKIFHASYGQCPLCYKDHVLMQCDKFIDMDIAQRNKTVAKLKVCKNCLYSHGNVACSSKKTCRECNLKHHTLLHFNKPVYNDSNVRRDQDRNSNPGPSTSTTPGAHHLATDGTEVLLTTIQIKVQSADGNYVTLRGLLDQGSQTNLISENAAQLLRLPRSKFDAAITGIGSTSRNCKGLLQLHCKSIHSDFTFNVQALILTNLTNKLPGSTFQSTGWTHLQNLKLADPNYNVSGSIDFLLGADVYADIILDGVLKGDQHSPIAQQTRLGWILCGKLRIFNCHLTLAITSDLSKYWEIEDIIPSSQDIHRDDQCETYY
ncbi:uncharacterized protein LOC142983392 [Anticarsia gemmatalis]|uniref:uncharacterized protein LOC142983392 n=1 Tax=Anticarsia gemmatalis TaxID=129554 RepID=UPI003F758FE4